jgi:fatty-acyl-CoA synthase
MNLRELYTLTQGFIIDKKAQLHPDRIAIHDATDGTRYSYFDLKERSDRYARFLLDRGLKKGQTVSALLMNTVEYFDLIFACAKMGCVFVPLNYRLSQNEIQNIISNARSPLVFYDPAFGEQVKNFSDEGREFIDISLMDLSHYTGETFPHKESDPTTPFVLIYTSGSAGEPKGVIQTHLNAFFKSIDSIIDFGMSYSDVVLVTAPLFHVAGLNALTLPCLHIGGRLILQRRFQADEALRTIDEEGVTCFAVVPTILKMIVNSGGFATSKLKSLRFIMVGGEPLDPTIQQAIADKGACALNVFGLSETTDGAIYQRIGHEPIKGCVGHLATHVDAKLMLNESCEAPEGEPGELVVKGGTVSPGYWENPIKTKETFKNGWVWTGDMAIRDDKGYFYMVGRSDDMIKSGAEKISPAEIELAICSSPKVADAVVFGVLDEKWGQVAKVVVAKKPGISLTEEEVIEICKSKMASYKKPRYVVILDQLPVSGSGKVDRALIRKLYSHSD